MHASGARVYCAGVMNQSSSTSSKETDTISRRAYELWEQEGRPEGCDLRHWLQAEQECRASSRTESSTEAPAAQSTPPNTDVRPLDGTRAAAAANREPKRNGPASPFGEKTSPGNQGQSGGKRRTAVAPAL